MSVFMEIKSTIYGTPYNFTERCKVGAEQDVMDRIYESGEDVLSCEKVVFDDFNPKCSSNWDLLDEED